MLKKARPVDILENHKGRVGEKLYSDIMDYLNSEQSIVGLRTFPVRICPASDVSISKLEKAARECGIYVNFKKEKNRIFAEAKPDSIISLLCRNITERIY